MERPTAELSQHILNNAPMAIVVTDDAGLVLWCNETLATWLGSEPGRCVGRTEIALLGGSEQVSSKENVPVSNGPFTLGFTQPGVERRVVRYPLPSSDGRYTVCYLDISEEEALRTARNQLAQQLEQHNTVDPVSGLLNEHAIQKGLEPLISRSRRYQNPLSVVTMHIPNLDEITQSSGQVSADKVIVAVSQLLRDQMRWADMVGRLDSGQFVFVLPETDQQAAVALANKIAGQITDFAIAIDDATSLQAHACFGVAAWSKGDDMRLLLSRSNDAAQTAVQNGAFAVEAA